MTDTNTPAPAALEGSSSSEGEAVEIAARAIWDRNNQRLTDIGWTGKPRASFNDATQEQRDHARTVAKAVIAALQPSSAADAKPVAFDGRNHWCGDFADGPMTGDAGPSTAGMEKSGINPENLPQGSGESGT